MHINIIRKIFTWNFTSYHKWLLYPICYLISRCTAGHLKTSTNVWVLIRKSVFRSSAGVLRMRCSVKNLPSKSLPFKLMLLEECLQYYKIHVIRRKNKYLTPTKNESAIICYNLLNATSWMFYWKIYYEIKR